MSATERVSVELPPESWRAIHAVLLGAAVEMAREGNEDGSADLMHSVVPTIGGKAAGAETKALNGRVREYLGLPALGSEVPAA